MPNKDYVYCPSCGYKLTGYYHSFFTLKASGKSISILVKQADCKLCHEQVLSQDSEKRIDNTVKWFLRDEKTNEKQLRIEDKLKNMADSLYKMNTVDITTKQICIQYMLKAKVTIETLRNDCGNLSEKLDETLNTITELENSL